MTQHAQAAVAMWWNVAPEFRTEFHEWHSKEHLPERLGIPGFRRGSRWEQAETPGEFFVLYELEDYATLTSGGYRARLNAPTPWSVQMMPRHRDMIRSQAHVLAAVGTGLATWLVALRFSPAPGQAAALQQYLERVLQALPEESGITAGWLLRTETPATAPTHEQQIRGGDAAADWIVLVNGHDRAALAGVLTGALAVPELERQGARDCIAAPACRLVHTLTPADV